MRWQASVLRGWFGGEPVPQDHRLLYWLFVWIVAVLAMLVLGPLPSK